MIDIGTYRGEHGLNRLLEETNKILFEKKRVIIAISGLPGVGKTRMVKNFVRLGFGNFRKKDILVIDDNIIYSTKCWKLKWEKISIEKKSCREFMNSINFKILFFSNWIPSRYIDFADILVKMEAKEHERIARLKKRYRKNTMKVLIQKMKTTSPIEAPFKCRRLMVLSDYNNDIRNWNISWMLRRLFV